MSKYKKRRSYGATDILLILLFLILLGFFLFCARYVLDYLTESKQQAAVYSDLAAVVDSVRGTMPPSTEPPETEPAETGETTVPTEPPLLPEYEALLALNPDLVGWLAIDGTPINYPVMQTPQDPEYYLYRDFNREKHSCGSIFAQESCDINAPSDNITIYGHNMKDRSMFGTLQDYRKQSYWEDHRYIRFDTLTQRHTYEIFAVFKTTASMGEGFAYHSFVDAADAEEFNRFVAACRRLALYDTGIVPQYGDKLICLSTCEYSSTNGRLVVAAYRIS